MFSHLNCCLAPAPSLLIKNSMDFPCHSQNQECLFSASIFHITNVCTISFSFQSWREIPIPSEIFNLFDNFFEPIIFFINFPSSKFRNISITIKNNFIPSVNAERMQTAKYYKGAFVFNFATHKLLQLTCSNICCRRRWRTIEEAAIQWNLTSSHKH